MPAIKPVLVAVFFAGDLFAQSDNLAYPSSSGFVGIITYILLLIGVASLFGAYFFRRRANAKSLQATYNYKDPAAESYGSHDSYDMRSVDADKEMEWLRNAKVSKPSKPRKTPQASFAVKSNGISDDGQRVETEPVQLDTRKFQENLRKLQYSQLPINSFSQLAPAKRIQELPISDDPALLTAIEQANDEFEEDEGIRDVAVRVLSAFRARNSVEALSQIALYDLSGNIRSKAVTVLSEFDHESVFETILLASADPTREVRAAAARGIFRLSFDRAHSWKRILETGDEFRMKQAARAAIEAGIVAKSFDRLAHDDLKIAYEAFALVSLLVKAGETKCIFEAIREHRDIRVKYALLHVLKVHKDEGIRTKLNEMLAFSSISDDVKERIREALMTLETVAA